jgi:hypothetical protein
VTELTEAIAPGDSVVVAVTLKSGRYLNEIRKVTKVYVDNSDEPAFLLTIQARVIKRGEPAGPYQLSPTVLGWKTESGFLTRQSDTILVTNENDKPVSVRTVYCPQACIKAVVLPEQILPGASGTIVIEIDEKTQVDRGDPISLTLAIDGSDTTLVTVPLEIED